MEKFTLANYVYMFCHVFRRQGNGILDDGTCIHNLRSEFFILGVPVHRFECFFFLTGLKFHIDFISVY